jgi:hypothetical protein
MVVVIAAVVALRDHPSVSGDRRALDLRCARLWLQTTAGALPMTPNTGQEVTMPDRWKPIARLVRAISHTLCMVICIMFGAVGLKMALGLGHEWWLPAVVLCIAITDLSASEYLADSPPKDSHNERSEG